MIKPTISKSQYVRGVQCPKSLWFYRHRKDLAPEVTPDKQDLFDTGEKIGRLAMQYFGGGAEVTNQYWDIEGAANATQQYIADGENIIFEATAIHPVDGCYSRIDILKRVEGSADEWDLIEVKSSTGVKDYHLDDMSFQYHVFHAAGYKIRSCHMMVLDNSYVRHGEIDPLKLFMIEDISAEVFSKQAEVNDVTGQLSYILERKQEPDIAIGARCFAPFECDYRPYCWAHVPDYSVYDIFRKAKAEEIAARYGVHIEDLPDTISPGGTKIVDMASYLSGEIIVDSASIEEFLRQLEHPLYFLDYETIMPALPLFDGTRPFQQIPFQFSVHLQQDMQSELVHHEFLHKERNDPRPFFVKRLVELCGDKGTILVYNQAFEMTRNRELMQNFPAFAEALQKINNRVVDLLVPFKNRWLYHPDQKGSASIKAVLPAFTNLGYADLEIGNGGEAMRQYSAFMSGALEPESCPQLWNNLSIYCKQDTYAMVEMLNILRGYAKGG